MNSKERVLQTLSHKEPERVAIDLGGWQSGISYETYERLKHALNLKRKTLLEEKMQGLAWIDQEVLKCFHVDTRYIFPVTLSENDQIPREEGEYTDAWGIVWCRPRGSFYYDNKRPAFGNAESIKDIDSHSWPSSDKLCDSNYVKEKIVELNTREYGIFTSLASVFEQATYVRGMLNFYTDILENPSFFEALLDKVLETEIGGYEKFLVLVGDKLDVIEIWDDFGSQQGPLISPELFRKYIKPREKTLIDFFKRKSNARVALHSCGSVYQFIPDFIEMGIDILNPIQTSAKEMDARKLKREFGNDLTFWGAIDTQKVLPFGSVEDVKKEVREKLDILAPGGGYIFAPCHNIQPLVPAENVLAMFEAANTYSNNS